MNRVKINYGMRLYRKPLVKSTILSQLKGKPFLFTGLGLGIKRLQCPKLHNKTISALHIV